MSDLQSPPDSVFLLERVRDRRGGDEWDVVNGQVVQAPTEDEARKLASKKASSEGSDVWLDPQRSTCVRLPDGGGSRVIMDKYVS